MTPEEKDEVLKNFMLEHFDFDAFKKAGFYGKEIKRKDYRAQADRICWFFGFNTIYEYGTKEIRCHISYGSGPAGLGSDRNGEPFITVVKSWFQEWANNK